MPLCPHMSLTWKDFSSGCACPSEAALNRAYSIRLGVRPLADEDPARMSEFQLPQMWNGHKESLILPVLQGPNGLEWDSDSELLREPEGLQMWEGCFFRVSHGSGLRSHMTLNTEPHCHFWKSHYRPAYSLWADLTSFHSWVNPHPSKRLPSSPGHSWQFCSLAGYWVR